MRNRIATGIDVSKYRYAKLVLRPEQGYTFGTGNLTVEAYNSWPTGRDGENHQEAASAALLTAAAVSTTAIYRSGTAQDIGPAWDVYLSGYCTAGSNRGRLSVGLLLWND